MQEQERQVGKLIGAEAMSLTRGRSIKHSPSESQSRGRSKSKKKKDIKCYNYGQRENVKEDCRNKKNREKNSQGNVARSSNDGNVL